MMNKINQERMKWLGSLYESCKVGEELYNILSAHCGNGTGIIFSPANVGDTVWLAALAEAYKKHHGYDKLLFVVKDAQTDIVRMFPAIDDAIPLKYEQVWCLRYYITLKQLYNSNDIRFGHWPADLTWEPPYIIHCLECEDSILEHMWETVLDIPFDSYKSKFILPQFDYNEAGIRELFENVVLLMPGSATVRGISEAFWVKLADRLKERGLTVCTNYAGMPYDWVVEGTEPLTTSLNEIAAFSKYFKSIVSIRSGICDLLAFTDCRLNILYPNAGADTFEIPYGNLDSDVKDLIDNRESRIINYWWNAEREDELIGKLIMSI